LDPRIALGTSLTAALRDFDPAYDRSGSSGPDAIRSVAAAHVRFAPKATVADQNVIRRFVP
jgi:hypothetical protein